MSASPPYDLKQIAARINKVAVGHPIGEFQDLRARLKGRRRTTTDMFVPRAGTFGETWAYHYGGRTELQFNIGLEERDGRWFFRHGVAFSLEPSQSYPELRRNLEPHILRYNEFMREYGNRFADMCLWFYGKTPSVDAADKVITDEILGRGHFFFVGKRTPAESFDVEQVVRDFDRLLDVYFYVEGKSYLSASPEPEAVTAEFVLTPRRPPQPMKTAVSWSSRHFDIEQRHRELEQALFEDLCRRHGSAAVFAEQPTGKGTQIDVVVKSRDGFWLYEVKTSTCVRSCIREGLAQLLEYAFWSPDLAARRLIVVGEPHMDANARRYLKSLRDRFGLPVYYASLDYATGSLGPEE